jgi:hypothetical protein
MVSGCASQPEPGAVLAQALRRTPINLWVGVCELGLRRAVRRQARRQAGVELAHDDLAVQTEPFESLAMGDK